MYIKYLYIYCYMYLYVIIYKYIRHTHLIFFRNYYHYLIQCYLQFQNRFVGLFKRNICLHKKIRELQNETIIFNT